MLNFNKDDSCKFVQSLLINQKFDIYSHILLGPFTNESAQPKVQCIWLHMLYRNCQILHIPAFETGHSKMFFHCKFILPSLLPFLKDFSTHLVLYCIGFGVASDTRLVSSSLLFGEGNRPAMFLLQKIFENELLKSMLNISKLLWDNSAPT